MLWAIIIAGAILLTAASLDSAYNGFDDDDDDDNKSVKKKKESH